MRSRNLSLAALPVAAVLTAAATYVATGQHRRIGATSEELAGPLPGDELVPGATQSSTRAITIDAPPEYVWPWIAQLGQDRGGFYSYTAVENLAGCRIRNADRIVPQWQHPAVGDPCHLHPDLALTIARVDEGEAFVLLLRPEPGQPPGFDFSWAFVLRPGPAGGTRFLIRERYRLRTTGAVATVAASEPISTVMTVGTLRGVRQRAEQLFRSGI